MPNAVPRRSFLTASLAAAAGPFVSSGNETRKRALRDAAEQPDAEALRILTEANRDAADWMRRATRE